MNIAAQITVTAAEFTRQFGQLRHTLGDRPVFVTHHGRQTHVLLSAARFARLRDQRDISKQDELVPAGIAQWIREGLIVLDAGGHVLTANDQAHALLGCPAGSLVGEQISTALPAFQGSVAERIVLRALDSREPVSADLPSIIRAGSWVQIDVHPANDGLTILFHDITAEVARDRLANEAVATERACVSHPDIARFRLNARGHIAGADETACRWVGLNSERLRGVAVADLMPATRKSEFRTTLDRVLSEGGETNVATALLSGKGSPLPIHAALVALDGCYGIEGAVMLATRNGETSPG